ncbi:MAG: hypothetical protein HFJ17_00440 [Clostridia bacterium]|nr:hypothetical protein [Clostridia bacterium]
MKIKLKNNKGITLIALVITIIVLLILAGVAISMLAGENGILRQAGKSKENTERATIEEKIQLAVLIARLNENNSIDYKTLNDELDKIGYKDEDLKKIPAEIVINEKHYAISKDGNAKEIQWYYDSDKNITNGIVTLKMGDYVKYDAKDGAITKTYTAPTGTYISDSYSSALSKNEIERGTGYSKEMTFDIANYTGKWKVLGVEQGEIKLISADNIGGCYLRGQTATMYGVDELNNICSIYGEGKGATRARCINIEDINKVTGYDPENTGTNKNDPNQELSGVKYNEGSMYEYGNEVEYSWSNKDGVVNYSSSNGLSGESSSSDTAHYKDYGFNYCDKNGNWYSSKYKSGDKIMSEKNTYYSYHPQTLTQTRNDDANVGIATDSIEYKTLFCNNAGNKMSYWLASQFVYSSNARLQHGIFHVFASSSNLNWGHFIYMETMYGSDGRNSGNSNPIRAIDYLDSSIKLNGNGTSGWIIEE